MNIIKGLQKAALAYSIQVFKVFHPKLSTPSNTRELILTSLKRNLLLMYVILVSRNNANL